jgi:hypothetical protein
MDKVLGSIIVNSNYASNPHPHSHPGMGVGAHNHYQSHLNSFINLSRLGHLSSPRIEEN